MGKKFDYGKAEADLYEIGDRHPEDIYNYSTEKGLSEYMGSKGLDSKKYYRGSSSSKTGRSGKPSSSGGGCYLTTACTSSRGLADNCDELETLRAYRDSYLKNRPGGNEDINEYYKTAPIIVEKINLSPEADLIWNDIYENMVVPCVNYIKSSMFDEVYNLYKSFVTKLESTYIR